MKLAKKRGGVKVKTIEEVLSNYSDYETDLEDRFGKRFTDFLTEEQALEIGFALTDDAKKDGKVWHEPLAWTEENVLAQLHRDVNFGWEKACDKRSISASLMYEVVQAWCKLLENGLEGWTNYAMYGKPLFRAVAANYGWKLEDEYSWDIGAE